MSKRSRGSRRAQQRRSGGRSGRPGRQGPDRAAQRSQPRPAEIAGVDEYGDELETGAPAREPERPTAATAAGPRSRARPSSVLAARAASEYVYVAQDVRRIVIVAAILFAVMFALWILIVVARVVPI